MKAIINPNWVTKLNDKTTPLVYYFCLPGNKAMFDVYMTGTPTGSAMVKLNDTSLNPACRFKLNGNEMIFLFPWELKETDPPGRYTYEIVQDGNAYPLHLDVIDYTFIEVMQDSQLGIVPQKGFGWVRKNPIDRSWATREFQQVIITAIERTYWQTGCEPTEFWDWSGVNGADLSDQHPLGSHKNGIAVDIKYVFKEPGQVDWNWFTALVENTINLTDKPCRFIVNDQWYANELWPSLSPDQQQRLFPHISSEAGHGGHLDHTHFNFS